MAIARLVDLKCTSCEHIESDVYCKSGDEPSCPLCSSPTAVYWGSPGVSRKADNFTPLTFEGVHYNTREEWQGHIRKLEVQHGDHIEVHSHSRSQARARADDVRHAGWLERKRRGIDSLSAFNDYKNGARR